MTHRLTRRRLLSTAAAALPVFGGAKTPAAYGVLPSDRQVLWHEMELYSFLHFTTNTFTDKEWGYGDEDPGVFHPTAFDADAIVSALKAGGMTGVILTCKHHDGYCLWPTKTTEHCVRHSGWRDGKGDVVREVSEAAKRHGLKFGVYLSPWDRNSRVYASPEYVTLYREQLRELLTSYGPIYEVWHDGANGGDGYYGGAREKRVIDKRTYYGWPKTWDMIRTLQPNAVVFSDVGPDIRWVGNESGYANDTCWATYDPVGEDGGEATPGDVRAKDSGTGTRNGKRWLPAECDVSIRPGWFWHAKENDRVKTPKQLMDLYFKSVGRGASFLLNLPPDRRGLLHENDVSSLKQFGQALRSTFAVNLATGAKAVASNVRGGDKSFSASNLLDGNRWSYWATDDSAAAPEVIFDLAHPSTFNVIRVRENIRLGQRVDSVVIDYWKDGAWTECGRATGVGSCRLIRTGGDITTTRIRLRVTQSPVAPALSDFGLFREV